MPLDCQAQISTTTYNQIVKERRELRAENKRLREALIGMFGHVPMKDLGPNGPEYIAMARAALNEHT